MLADEKLREGNLDEALAALKDEVRKNPANSKYRVFLFQLQSVLGDWERAMTQLKVLGDLDSGTLTMVQMYREALKCEALRAEIFAGKRSPLIFGEPEEWIAWMIQALQADGEGRPEQAAELRAKALEQAPATSGQVGDQTFEWIADADSRLGPLLEVVIFGRYYWVPFHRIREIQIEEPADLRDFVWTPAMFTWANAGEAVGLIPTRYPGSERSADGAVRLARRTEWIEQGPDTYHGLGQRMFATDGGDLPLLETRAVRLDVEAEAASGSEITES